MYGYVKPYRPELKVREHEHYKAAYCGLCHTLKRKYGFMSRFLVNYDFALLAIVLHAMEFTPCEYESKRCVASPHKKKCICVRNRAIDFTASATVILAYWKICDNIADKSFLKGFPYRVLKLLHGSAYRKAKKELGWFDDAVRDSISQLNELEAAKEKSIDRVADTFANLLSSLADYFEDATAKRISKELFYHIGRVIYILDALFDVDEDKKSGNYNPILISKMTEDSVVTTINCSLNTAVSIWALVADNELTDLVTNVLTLGIPSVIKEKGEKR